jgi:hypothetical protein
MRAAVFVWVWDRSARTSTARRSNPRVSRVVRPSVERESIAATKAAVSVLRSAAVASSSTVIRPVKWAWPAARRSAHRARSVATRAAVSARRRMACASRSPAWTRAECAKSVIPSLRGISSLHVDTRRTTRSLVPVQTGERGNRCTGTSVTPPPGWSGRWWRRGGDRNRRASTPPPAADARRRGAPPSRD